MRTSIILRRASLLILVALGTAPVPVVSARLGGQNDVSQVQSDLRDLAANKTTLENDSGDLEAMATSIQGSEQETLIDFDTIAQKGFLEVDATISFLGVYSKMQCEPDRATAKATLENRIGFYSHILSLEVDHTNGTLAFAKLPATAQEGTRLRDDLRAAKDKLDGIAASLKSVQ